MSPKSFLTDVLTTLGVLILRRDPVGEFAIEGGVPVWYARLFPGREQPGEPLPLFERFPFLESFLPTAENFWASDGQGRIRSGYWVEVLPAGQEVPLQASAVLADGVPLLLIEFVKGVYEQEKGFLQKARENSLTREEYQDVEQRFAELTARHRALREHCPGVLLRVRANGTVAESNSQQSTRFFREPPAEGSDSLQALLHPLIADRVQVNGTLAMDSGDVRDFTVDVPDQKGEPTIHGRVIPLAESFWALLSWGPTD